MFRNSFVNFRQLKHAPMKSHSVQQRLWYARFKVTACCLTCSFLLQSAHAQTTGCIGGNCVNGIGTWLFENGDEYTGEWVGSNRTGLGVYDWENGSYYYGYFVNGILEGKGVYIGTDEAKTTLIGTFQNGVLAQENNFIQTGCFLGDCTNGVGAYLWENDDIYLGEWEAGQRSGYGRYDWKDGSLYTGYFKNNLFEGEGEYIGTDDEHMKGLFKANEFQGASSTVTNNNSKPSYSSGSSTVTEMDFCSLMQAVIKDYANNFENLKGVKEESEWALGNIWFSNIKATGSADARVSEAMFGGKNTWYNVVYESTNFNSAQSHYDDLVTQMRSCKTGCCIMVSDTSQFKGESYTSYTTAYLTFMVNEGYGEVYEKMLLELELHSNIITKGWEIVARVSYFDGN